MFMRSHIHSYEDARAGARRRLPWMVFDYIDGAAGEGYGEALNLAALQGIRLQPRVLVNVAKRNIGVKVFDQQADLPFGISPMGMCNLAAPGADLMFARMAARHNIPHGASTVASTSMEEILEASNGNAWFQLYFSGDGSGTIKLVERAKAAGYQTLVLTLDVPELGRRPRELRRGFKMPFRIGLSQFIDFALHPHWSISQLFHGKPDMANFLTPGYEFNRTESRAGGDWEFLKKLRDIWPGNLVAKGVTSVEDAVKIKEFGIEAIQVSTHGGRQLDSAVSPILALKAIRQEVGDRYPLFYDTGIRSGEDVVKAYAMGANFVFFGRAMQFAVASGGEGGLQQYFKLVSDEIHSTLAQLGKVDMNDLSGSLV